jgi:putative ABC transport system ATP-binding protein
VISARNVFRSYDDGERGQVRVLDGLSLDVEPGEFVAVVGRSGSGKSTLLHVLGGLDTAYRGEVTVAGIRLSGLSDAALARFRNEQIGFVFQSFHLVPGLSVRDNVALPGFFARNPPADAEARALEALRRVGLAEKAGRLPGQLSGGERQRVAIARALFARPKVLLCDEPTGNLDAATSEQVVSLFAELNRSGLTVLAVTHEDRLRRVASRVLTLEDGKLS